MATQVGERILGPDECHEVAEFVIVESVRPSQKLMTRLLVRGFADRMQADGHASGLAWQDLVTWRIHHETSVVGRAEPTGIPHHRCGERANYNRPVLDLEPYQDQGGAQGPHG